MAALERLKKDFYDLRNPTLGKKRIKDLLKPYEQDKTIDYLADWIALSKEHEHVYPSQGLLKTPFDYLSYQSIHMLPLERIIKTLRLRWFFLEMFNHPYRIHYLKLASKASFTPPPKVHNPLFDYVDSIGLSLSIGDLSSQVQGTIQERRSRNERYAQGPFIKFGKQARIPFLGSSVPDVWNSSLAIATMAASHALSAIPRNGVMSDITRQADLARETFVHLKNMSNQLLKNRADKDLIYSHWKNNVMGSLETSVAKAMERAEALYKQGVRVFRVYSPEPGTGTVETTKALRKKYGGKIEIIAGQIIDVEEGKRAQSAGADALIVGVGGGGRCITGVRSGSAISWPSLVWQMRGEIDIPVIVDGGASDQVANTFLLGASGIMVSRVVGGGTIESPGGALFLADKKGRLFKPYGGEASARTKYLDGKLLPFEIPSFVEGETTKAYMSYVKHVLPTLTYNLHLLLEDAILAMVFRNVDTVHDLHALDPSPLRQITSSGSFQRGTH